MSLNDLVFVIGGVGGGLVLPAWLFWARRRSLADERFPKDADGRGVFAGQTVDEADQVLLMRWQRRMVMTFVLGMTLLPLLVIGAATLDVLQSPIVGFVAFLAIFAAALLLLAFVQLSAKCPRCEFRIGLQSRLLLPKTCDRCGVAFRPHDRQAQA